MELTELRLLHVPKNGVPDARALPFPTSDRALTVDTCQRRIAVAASGRHTAGWSEIGEVFQGVAAYQFLLELAAGLKSAIAGEGEILGQLRHAWNVLESGPSEVAVELSPLMQRVLADAKEVRERYLRGAGGQSYGSLLRKVLKPRTSGSTLLIGAGQLASAILPYLAGQEILIWNRSAERGRALSAARVRSDGQPSVRILEPTLDAELAAWRSAETVIVCVPEDSERDELRVAAWRQNVWPNGQLVHLGLLCAKSTVWESLGDLMTLESLHACDLIQIRLRSERLALARRFCAERARLRHLGRSVSIAHGWEDLALFQGLIETRADATLPA